jgi:hypothetical protein
MTSQGGVIPPIQDIEFSAEAQVSGQAVTLKLVGNADLNVKAQLDRFMAAVHEEALKIVAEEVTVDLRRLEFMNSSCLKSFVWWISSVQDMQPGSQYRITFLSSPSMYWQRRSLNALACLATELVSVQV